MTGFCSLVCQNYCACTTCCKWKIPTWRPQCMRSASCVVMSRLPWRACGKWWRLEDIKKTGLCGRISNILKIDMGLCFNYLCSALQLVTIVLFGLFQISLRNCIQSDNTPMHLVGKFLQIVFTNHSLPKRCGQNLFLPSSVHSFPETTQLLHYCPGCSQAQLIHLIISIYDGVPESFEVFRCHSSSSKEELSLFLNRMAKHPLQYLILEINQLSFKLQEVSS